VSIVIIDTHAHIIVPEITRQFAPSEDWRPAVFYDDSLQVVDYKGKRIKSAVRPFVHIEEILAEQESAGVDRVLLCPWVTLLRYEVDPQESLRSARVQNQALAHLAQAHPERVYGLGTVPLQDPALAVRELASLMQEPGLYGLEVAASVRGIYLGDERFLPFWEAAEENDAIVFIHLTTRGFDSPVFGQYYLWNAIGNPLETTISAAHMIMAGVMERYPRLKVLLAHGGGSILALRGRLNHAHSFQPQAQARLKEAPDASLKRFYFDSLTHDEALLRQLIDFAGAERIVMGSDYPFDMGSKQPAGIVRRLDLPAEQEAMILGRNTVRLLGDGERH
jgi:aminocarboxymuconate-semialdehyde decarboxylase